MSHWCQQMVDGAEHLINCDWLAFLSAFSHLQLIQNSAPSNICWCQCDIRINQTEVCLWKLKSLSLVFSLVFRIHIPDEDWNVHQHFHIYLLNPHRFPHENFHAHEIHACLAQCLIWHYKLCTSKFIWFSVKLAKFWKISIKRVFLCAHSLFLLLNMRTIS